MQPNRVAQDPIFSETLPTPHHVGFVVASIEGQIAGFARSIGAESISEMYEDPLQSVKVAFVIPAAGPQIELVEPLGEKSPVTAFLAHGGGLHHICYEVDGLEQHLAGMRKLGATLVRRAKPAVAFGGRRIAWMLTRERLLVEYLERRHPAATE